MKINAFVLLLCLLVVSLGRLSAQVPGLINYQGRVAVGGVNFDGNGQFKFSLVNGDGTTTYWSNDGTFSGEPAAAVSLAVTKGLYSILLGDPALANMQPVQPTVFQNNDVRLRVWFNDGTHGFQQLTPDQRIAAVGYAMMAGTVPDGSINQFKLAPGAVTGNSIQPGAIDSTHLSNGAVRESNIAAGAVTRDAIADGAVSGAKLGDSSVDTRHLAAASIGGESWIATPNPEDGPVGRFGHSVVWTGTEFIIWGGVANVFGGPAVSNTGARFNPSTGVWINITLTGAPAARRGHTAVWTGTEMIVWGGTSAQDGESGGLNSGGRYNPATDKWINTGGGFGVPVGRRNHTAVWTGTDMLIWGGQDAAGTPLATGSKLNEATNFWEGVATEDAPAARYGHSAIWTGSKMVVWGGNGASGPLDTGNVYDAAFDVWASTPMPLTGAPDARSGHSVVWTGTDMIVWGGDGASAQPVGGGTSFQRGNGGRYRVATNSWHPMGTTGAPAHRTGHTAVWTGGEMLVWGGNFTTDAGGGTGTAGSLDDGAVYFPASDTWRAMIQPGAPAARTGHTAAWTGREMIVWGGNGQGNLLNTGGRYRISLIANGAVGTNQLANGAVRSANIADGAVGSAQLGTGAVLTGNLADGAVGSANLQPGAVNGAAIANGTITHAKLAPESVDTANIADEAVGANQLRTQSVTALALAAGSVTADKIFNGQVTEPKLASSAVTTPKIADRAVTEEKLAIASVGSVQIADGAVLPQHLAAGSVGFEMLAKPPQAGTVSLDTSSMRFGYMEFSVDFPTSYTTPPVITTSVQGGGSSLAVTVTSVEANRFSGMVKLVQGPITFTAARIPPNFYSVRVVENGGIAAFFYDLGTKKIHYTESFQLGQSSVWEASNSVSPVMNLQPVEIPGSPIADRRERLFDVIFTNSFPKYFWVEESVGSRPGRLMFSSGGSQQILDEGAADSINNSPKIGSFLDLSAGVVGQRFAIAYRDIDENDLKFVRAIDANASEWGIPITLDAEGNVGSDARLIEIGSNAYVTYADLDNNCFKCVRALNGDGSQWATPVTLPLSSLNPGFRLRHSLVAINGRPAIVYGHGSLLYLQKASNSEATLWGAREVIASAPQFADVRDMEIRSVNNKTVVTYRLGSSGQLFTIIGDVNGNNWTQPIEIASVPIQGTENSVPSAPISRFGKLAVLYYDVDNGALREVREIPASSPFTINWIALPK